MSVMSAEHGLKVALYHLSKAETPGLRRYWQLVVDRMIAKL